MQSAIAEEVLSGSDKPTNEKVKSGKSQVQKKAGFRWIILRWRNAVSFWKSIFTVSRQSD